MLAEERFALILNLLAEKRTATVQELCEALNASESTIRRDLTELDRQGRLNKVHGGATLPDGQFLADEPTMAAKETLAVGQKRSIAQAAADLVRAGDFVYSPAELESMHRDVETCARLGCDGIVIGMLDAGGAVDVAGCRALVATAGAMGVTFHRAFDCVADRHLALDAVVALGCERILTSGGADRAERAARSSASRGSRGHRPTAPPHPAASASAGAL